MSPTPVRYVRQMGAELVIAVDISSAPEGNPAGDSMQILLQTFAIMGKSINSYELRDADVVVRPALVGVGSADFTARRRAIEAGRTRHATAAATAEGGDRGQVEIRSPDLSIGAASLRSHARGAQ